MINRTQLIDILDRTKGALVPTIRPTFGWTNGDTYASVPNCKTSFLLNVFAILVLTPHVWRRMMSAACFSKIIPTTA